MNGNEDATRTSGTIDRSLTEEVEVAVVGAGPTGLTLAGMLSGYGIQTAVLDGAAGPARHSRAAVVHARTLETLEPLGVVGEMLGGGVVVPHFGVRDRDRLLLGVDFDGLPTTHPYTLMLPQDRTERILLGALHEQGGRVLWEHEAVGLSQDEGGVELVVRGARGERRVRARYVVGCDGGHSFVRGALAIPFQGESYPQSFVLADVRMSWALPEDEVQLFFSPEGLVVVAPLPQGHHRVVATVDEAPAEPSLSDVQELLYARGLRARPPRVEEVIWSSHFRVQHRIAARFREGGVFLCGDAAHVHSPAGGQGMNTGIQDAANLAWKLALVVRGRAPGSLLDSYERERRPVARGVVSTTDRLTRLATVRSPLLRRLRNALIPIAGRAGRLPRRLATNLSELDVSYRAGWSVDGSKTVERWAPKGQGVLSGLDPTLTLVVPEQQGTRAAEEAARFRTLPVRVVQRTRLGHAALVRPDGYVAGRVAPEQHPRLLELLARALGA
jgi:2-polyprenyl-6-methoxyphenol hydroxylase-like FAD-dependent oxidoreductase